MAAPERTKRCLYDVLGVNRDCSHEGIRSAYKRLALQLHPDKLAQSGADSADATAAFQELLHAYEVLSDPKERSWYDSHRSQIIFSAPAGTDSHSAPSPFDFDLFSFFSASAFSGLSDTGRGFYKVYGDLFGKIYSQELRFAKELGLAPDAVPPAPLIGNLDSPHSQVTAFYNYWLGFCTVLDFGWADKFDWRMGPNRKSRRLMEEENKKLRKKARREYNDTVRGLAAFVKKRDKRVVLMQAEKKLEEQRQQAKEKKRKEEERLRKLERVRLFQESEWAQIDEEAEEELLNDGLYDTEGDDKKKDKGKGGEELYCVVCSKKFKSDKQWKNHEQSKKHRDKVAELRESLQDEDGVLEGFDDDDDDGEGTRVGFDYVPEPDEDSDADVVVELPGEFEDGIDIKEESVEKVALEGSEQDLGSGDEASVLEAMLSRNKSRKAVNLEQPDSTPSKKTSHDGDDRESCMEYDIRKKGRRNRATKKGNHAKADAEAVRTRETNGTLQDDSEILQKEGNAENRKESSSRTHTPEEVNTSSRGGQDSGKNGKLKKQQGDGKGVSKKDTDAVSNNSTKGKKQKGTLKPSNACGTCGESFDTRNKLFAHLGNTGHAVLKSR